MGNGCDIIITWGGAIFNMTNEELATAIQNGETELYPVLWEKIEKLIDRKAEIYALNLAICGRRLDPVEFKKDLKQSAYFALIAAVNYFDPESGYKFLTYLNRPLLSEFRRTAGIRTSRQDILDTALYLDTPVGDDTENTFTDTVPDPTNDIADCDESVYIWELRAALDDAFSVLTDREREVLTLRYYFGVNYSKQAANKNVSSKYISLVASEAFEKIRNNRQIMTQLAGFMPQYEYDPFRFTGYSSWQQSDLSVQDRYLMGQMDNQDEALCFLL